MAESHASRTAASTRSAIVAAVSAGSAGSITLGSIVTSSNWPTPLTTARTAPPRAVPVPSAFASSCCAFIACCAAAKICCMSKPPGPITRSLLGLTDGLARSPATVPADPGTGGIGVADGPSVLVLGDDLGAKFPLHEGHAGELVHRRRGRHVLIVGVKILIVRRRGRRQRRQVPAAPPPHRATRG